MISVRETSKTYFNTMIWDNLKIRIFTITQIFVFYLIRDKILIRKMKFSKILSLGFKSYESCSIFRIQNFGFQNPLKKNAKQRYMHMIWLHFFPDSVKWKFLKFAHANFEIRIFFNYLVHHEVRLELEVIYDEYGQGVAKCI